MTDQTKILVRKASWISQHGKLCKDVSENERDMHPVNGWCWQTAGFGALWIGPFSNTNDCISNALQDTKGYMSYEQYDKILIILLSK